MHKGVNKLMVVGTFITGTYIALKSFTFTVYGGYRGLIFDKSAGLQTKIYGEGMHLKVPFLQSAIIQQISLQANSVAQVAVTKDQQTIDITIRMLHRPIEEHLVEIYNSIGLKYQEKILPQIVNEVLNSVIAKYDTSQLVSMNDLISQEVKDGLTDRAKQFNITLEDVSIIHLGFSKEYAQAIEQKFVAQQQVQRQKFIADKNDQDRIARLQIQEGEAIGASYINDAVKQIGGVQIEIKRLDATKIFADMFANMLNLVNQKKLKK